MERKYRPFLEPQAVLGIEPPIMYDFRRTEALRAFDRARRSVRLRKLAAGLLAAKRVLLRPDAQARDKGHLDESCREKIPISCVVGILGESGEPEKPLPALGPSQLEQWLRMYFSDSLSETYEFRVHPDNSGYVLDGGGADLVRLEVLRQRGVTELAVHSLEPLGEATDRPCPCLGLGLGAAVIGLA